MNMVKLRFKPRGVENLSSKLVCSGREFSRSSLGELEIPTVLLRKKKVWKEERKKGKEERKEEKRQAGRE